MFRLLNSMITAVAFLAVISCTPTLESRIDDMVEMYTEKDLFSGVVLYAENGKILYNKAFGYADREKEIENNISTKFNIGSLNKDLTTVIILQLAERDSLDLDAPIGNYIDDFEKEILDSVTVRLLLRHEAGFADYLLHSDFLKTPDSFKTVSNLIQLIKNQKLLFNPGSDRYYSNSGFVVLGKIIEEITGKSYEKQLQSSILNPLNMENTYYSNLDVIDNNATGYSISATGKLHAITEKPVPASPAGGCYSTTGDLFKFYNALENTNILLSDSYKKIMYTRANINIQLSWDEIIKDPSIFNAKAGGLEGFNAMVIEWMAKKELTIVLANYEEPAAENVGMGVFTLMKDMKPEEPDIPAEQYVYRIYREHGFDYISAHYDSLMNLKNYQYDNPWLLNQVGYDLLHENKVEEAIQIFKLNVQRFPEEANTYDSLGEAYMKNEEYKSAIDNYSKSLQLDPDNRHAAKVISELSEKIQN